MKIQGEMRHFRISQELLDRLDAVAEKEYLSRSEIVRKLLDERLKQIEAQK